MNKQIFIGINKNNELISVELDLNDLNKHIKPYNPYYYITIHGYSNIIYEDQGIKEAKERLEDIDYWKDLGYLDNKFLSVLSKNINFENVANEVIDSDGWEHVNGEYYYIGDYNNLSYYINLQFIGSEKENLRLLDYKVLFISKEDFIFLFSNEKFLISDKKKCEKLNNLFNKEQNKELIIKSFLKCQNGDNEYNDN